MTSDYALMRDTYRQRLLAVYDTASKDTKRQGKEWYRNAQTASQRIARDYGLSVDTVARVIAALSPANKWERNLLDARSLVRAYAVGDEVTTVKVCTFNVNKLKAWAILNGDHSALQGRKVVEFYLNIAGNSDRVTIDGHMANVCKGTSKPMTAQSHTPIEFRAMQAAVKSAARCRQVDGRKLSPAEFQAIVWIEWRRAK